MPLPRPFMHDLHERIMRDDGGFDEPLTRTLGQLSKTVVAIGVGTLALMVVLTAIFERDLLPDLACLAMALVFALVWFLTFIAWSIATVRSWRDPMRTVFWVWTRGYRNWILATISILGAVLLLISLWFRVSGHEMCECRAVSESWEFVFGALGGLVIGLPIGILVASFWSRNGRSAKVAVGLMAVVFVALGLVGEFGILGDRLKDWTTFYWAAWSPVLATSLALLWDRHFSTVEASQAHVTRGPEV